MLASCCISPLSYAEANNTADVKPVSKAFLTYLAELVEVDGKLVHPTELDKNTSEKLDEQLKRSPNKLKDIKKEEEQ